MYIESQPGQAGFPTAAMQGFGATAADFVTMMGDAAETATPAGVTCPPGQPYCVGKSNLSPQDLARVQDQNRALQQQAYNQQKRTETMIVVGVVGALVLGIGFAIYKATRE